MTHNQRFLDNDPCMATSPGEEVNFGDVPFHLISPAARFSISLPRKLLGHVKPALRATLKGYLSNTKFTLYTLVSDTQQFQLASAGTGSSSSSGAWLRTTYGKGVRWSIRAWGPCVVSIHPQIGLGLPELFSILILFPLIRRPPPYFVR